jgi:hypothetical protein
MSRESLEYQDTNENPCSKLNAQTYENSMLSWSPLFCESRRSQSPLDPKKSKTTLYQPVAL